jgi:glycosyltransferase involved in cell wall biosynthesis
MAKVSIIIPTYKRGDVFLQRAIDSALAQTWVDIEIVVVDDNVRSSPERTQTEQLMTMYSNHERVMYIQNVENLGGARSRNVGIEHATGDYITFLDDDDLYLPSKVEKQLQFMLQNELDVCFTDLRIHTMTDELADYREYSRMQDFTENGLFKYHLLHHITGTPTFMYKTEVIRKIEGFDAVPMGQEFYLMLKTIRAQARIGYLPDCDVIAYLHDHEKISSGRGKIKGERALFAFKKQYFAQFSIRERLHMRARHYAVLALAYHRLKKPWMVIYFVFAAFLSSPLATISESMLYIRKMVNNNKKNK